MLRTPTLCRGLAAAAVLAVTVGCSVDRTAGGPERVDPKPGGAATASGSSPAPSASKVSPSVSPSPSDPASSNAKPSGSAKTAPRPATVLARGAQNDRVRELQARLRQIGHFDRTPTGYYGSVTASAVSSFQRKRGLPGTGTTDTVTWQRLLAMTKQPTGAELRPPTANALPKPDPRCMTGRVMCINKTSRTLAWMIDGKVRSSMDVRFGAQYTPTREGTFSVYWKSRHHVSTLYDSPMPYAMFFSGGQAVHYSSDFAARGYAGASHGCVNVRDEGKIASLFAQVHNGDKVVIYK